MIYSGPGYVDYYIPSEPRILLGWKMHGHYNMASSSNRNTAKLISVH
jgi:hypothetical protein